MIPKKAILHVGIFSCIIGDLLASYWILTLADFSKILGLALHIACVAVFFLIVKRLNLRDEPADSNFALVSLLVTAVLPAYGMFGIYGVYLSLQRVEIEPVDYFEFEEDFLSNDKRTALENISENILGMKRDELEIMSFRDIFQGRDQQLEENAINKLAKIVNKQSVSILQEVVSTTTADTKILAASALIDMEDKITNRVEELRATLKEEPDNHEVRLELGRAYDLYCHLGVRDTVVKNYYQKLALEQYQHFLRMRPGHPDATFEYGRILLGQGQTDQAIHVFQEATELAPKDPGPQVWLAEAYYEKEDYSAVYQICNHLYQKRVIPAHLKDVVEWWAAAQNPAQPATMQA